ncbi:hypothetical protein LSH36_100g03007, partial [Paralvinella palmiformis]
NTICTIFVPLAYSVKADNDEDDERLREKVNQERSTENELNVARSIITKRHAKSPYSCQYRDAFVFQNGECIKVPKHRCPIYKNKFYSREHCKLACIQSHPALGRCSSPPTVLDCRKFYCKSDSGQCKKCPTRFAIMMNDVGYDSKSQCREQCS